ncbi:MAG: AlpA family transcriptional regulator [Denitrovibrio sp.]|mgnify:CR=1 FL=1|nr:MAG: AlpA family transcriptional regulator [Denitrovibrio sp.]
MNTKLCRLPEVIKLTGLSRSSIYALMAKNKFPQPIKLSERSVAWVSTDIQSWIDEKISISRGA